MTYQVCFVCWIRQRIHLLVSHEPHRDYCRLQRELGYAPNHQELFAAEIAHRSAGSKHNGARVRRFNLKLRYR